MKTAQEIIAALAVVEPLVPSECGGDLSCFFCGAWAYTRDEMIDSHRPDCLWQAAKKLAESGSAQGR